MPSPDLLHTTALAIDWRLGLPKFIALGSVWARLYAAPALALATTGVAYLFSPLFPQTLRAAQQARRWLKQEALVCPHAGCYAAVQLPLYMCPDCGREHDDLEPRYGRTFAKACPCGRQLPALGAARDTLPAQCPHCRKPLNLVRANTLRIPLLAGPSAGKSSYLMGAMRVLADQAEEGRLGLSFPSPKYHKLFEASQAALMAGTPPRKTPDIAPDAFACQLKDKAGSQAIVHLYDAAGELFDKVDDLRHQQYLGKSHGFLFLIDPFSLPDLRQDPHSAAVTRPEAVRPSETLPQATYDRVMAALREQRQAGQQRLPIPVAVVLTKSDALGFAPQDSAAVRQWLAQHGEGNLVRSLERDFTQVRYFAVSALGRSPDESGQPFSPRGVLDPFAWLLAFQGLRLAEAVRATSLRARVRQVGVRAAAVAAVLLGLVFANDGAYRVWSPGLLRACARADDAWGGETLLLKGTPLEAPDAEGRTPLALAAAGDCRAIARLLLQRQAAASPRDREGATPLDRAAEAGYTQMADLLIGGGAPVNLADRDKHTPLTRAYLADHRDTFELLLQRKASPDTRLPDGTPLVVAATDARRKDFLQPLIEAHCRIDAAAPDGHTALASAVLNGQAELSGLLCAFHANPNQRTTDGSPLVVVAARKGDEPTLETLLDAGASPNVRDNEGHRPLELVIPQNRPALLKALLAARARLDEPNHEHDAPLLQAVSQAQAPTVAALLDAGAPLALRGAHGHTAYMRAIAEGRTDLFQALFRRPGPVNACTVDGEPTLLMLLRADEAKVKPEFKLLALQGMLAHGADANAADRLGQRPLNVAIDRGRRSLAEALLRAGADPTLRGARGLTAAQLAKDHQQTDLYEACVAAVEPRLAPLIQRADAQLRRLQLVSAAAGTSTPSEAPAQPDSWVYRCLAGNFGNQASASRCETEVARLGYQPRLLPDGARTLVVVQESTERAAVVQKALALWLDGIPPALSVARLPASPPPDSD